MGDDVLLQVFAFVVVLPVALAAIAKNGLAVPGVSFLVLGNWVIGTHVRLVYLGADTGNVRIPTFTTMEHAIGVGLVVLGFASLLFFFGYVTYGRRKLVSCRVGRYPGGVEDISRLDRRVLLMGAGAVVWAWFWVGLYVAVRFGTSVDFWSLFVVSSAYRTFEISAGVFGNNAGILAPLIISDIVGAYLIFALLVGARGRGVGVAIGWVLVAGIFGAAVTKGLLLGSRWLVLKPVLVLAWGHAILRGVTPGRALAAVGSLALVGAPVVVMQGLVRRAAEEGKIGNVGETPTLVESLAQLTRWIGETGHFLAVERVGYITEYVILGFNEFPFAGSFAAAALAWIPRAIWPDKPQIHEGVFVADQIAGHFSGAGFPAGLIGGLLLNFGALGILGMIPYGWLVRWLDERANKARGDVRSFVIVMTFGFVIGFDMLQSSIATSIVEIVMRFGGVLFVMVLFPRQSRRAGALRAGWTGAVLDLRRTGPLRPPGSIGGTELQHRAIIGSEGGQR